MNNILITGGAKRIGAKVCEEIAGLPHKKNIIIHYHDSHDEAEELKKKLSSENTKILLFQADLTKIEEIQSLIKFIEQNFDHIDTLINNASIFRKDSFLAGNDDKYFIHYANVHLTATFLLSKFLMSFQSNKKIIINMLDDRRGSNEKIRDYGDYFYYSMTKHMMFVMHEYLRKECEKIQNVKIYGLLLGLILPNKIDADFFEKKHVEQKDVDERMEKISKTIEKIFAKGDLESQDFLI